MEIVAVIHAKGESERLPGKNLKFLGDIPLVAHAILNARKSKATRVIIDSDSKAILNIGAKFGAEPLLRPPYLARNEITGDDLAYWQAQNFPDYNIIVQVVPTSPFTKSETINECIDNVITGYNSSFTASSEKFYTWSQKDKLESITPDYLNVKNKILNSKNLPLIFVEHTGVYAFKTEFAFKERKRIDINDFRTVPVSDIEKIDINTEEDFEFAEVIWKGLNFSSP